MGRSVGTGFRHTPVAFIAALTIVALGIQSVRHSGKLPFTSIYLLTPVEITVFSVVALYGISAIGAYFDYRAASDKRYVLSMIAGIGVVIALIVLQGYYASKYAN